MSQKRQLLRVVLFLGIILGVVALLFIRDWVHCRQLRNELVEEERIVSQINLVAEWQALPNLDSCVLGAADVQNLKRVIAAEWEPGVRFTDDDVARISELKHLEKMSFPLSDRVTDLGLEHISECEALKVLVIPGSDEITSAGTQYLCDLSQLKVLELGAPMLSDDGFKFLACLSSLQSFSFSGRMTKFDGAMRRLAQLNKLRALSLEGVELADGGAIRYLGSHEQLKYLSLRECVLGAVTIHAISNIVSLEELELELRFDLPIGDEERLDALINAQGLELEQLGQLINLRRLTLPYGSGSSKILKRLSNLVRLEYLGMPGANIGDEDILILRAFAQLRGLDLSGNERLTDAGLRNLKWLEQLRHVDISGTNITTEGIRELQTLRPEISVTTDSVIFPDAVHRSVQ